MPHILSNDEFIRLFRQLNDASHWCALDVLATWKERATDVGSTHARRRLRTCKYVLGEGHLGIYR